MNSMDIVLKGKFHLNASVVNKILSLCPAQEPFVCLASSGYRGHSVKGELYQHRMGMCLAFQASALIWLIN